MAKRKTLSYFKRGLVNAGKLLDGTISDEDFLAEKPVTKGEVMAALEKLTLNTEWIDTIDKMEDDSSKLELCATVIRRSERLLLEHVFQIGYACHVARGCFKSNEAFGEWCKAQKFQLDTSYLHKFREVAKRYFVPIIERHKIDVLVPAPQQNTLSTALNAQIDSMRHVATNAFIEVMKVSKERDASQDAVDTIMIDDGVVLTRDQVRNLLAQTKALEEQLEAEGKSHTEQVEAIRAEMAETMATRIERELIKQAKEAEKAQEIARVSIESLSNQLEHMQNMSDEDIARQAKKVANGLIEDEAAARTAALEHTLDAATSKLNELSNARHQDLETIKTLEKQRKSLGEDIRGYHDLKAEMRDKNKEIRQLQRELDAARDTIAVYSDETVHEKQIRVHLRSIIEHVTVLSYDLQEIRRLSKLAHIHGYWSLDGMFAYTRLRDLIEQMQRENVAPNNSSTYIVE